MCGSPLGRSISVVLVGLKKIWDALLGAWEQKDSEKKEIAAGIQEGSLSIVVGTHALLGSRIQYHNLGLLIVDEEQVISAFWCSHVRCSCMKSS